MHLRRFPSAGLVAMTGFAMLVACKPAGPGPAGSGDAVADLQATVVAKATSRIYNTPVPSPTTPPEEAAYANYPKAIHVLAFHPTDPQRMWVTFGPKVITLDITDEGAIPNTARDILTGGPLVFAFIAPAGGDMFMGGQGIFKRSTDEGKTWTEVAALQKVDIEGLVADPKSPTTLIALVGGRGVVRSTDNGITWETVAADVPEGAFGLWAVRSEPLRLLTYDHTALHLLSSDDGGKSWKPIVTAGLSERPYQVSLQPDGRAFAGAETGLYVSTDGGDTWTKPGAPKPPNLYALGVPPGDPDTVVAMGQGGALYRSYDSGLSWGGKAEPTP